ncbi:hypothetical protein TL16_g11530 [Triparma laevis f. inornata]|uniref:Transcription factor Iwr1 domain-containing protein n=1 Tax=Triparma laevis f. inornata TaxID=1714386 RepID=A0A9W7BFP8_9STRA|nr:hypothetical protein TL16_g11530 [Triparma laevis f. inornata]
MSCTHTIALSSHVTHFAPTPLCPPPPSSPQTPPLLCPNPHPTPPKKRRTHLTFHHTSTLPAPSLADLIRLDSSKRNFEGITDVIDVSGEVPVNVRVFGNSGGGGKRVKREEKREFLEVLKTGFSIMNLTQISEYPFISESDYNLSTPQGGILHLCVLLRSRLGVDKFSCKVDRSIKDSQGKCAEDLGEIMGWSYLKEGYEREGGVAVAVTAEEEEDEGSVYDVYTIDDRSENSVTAQSNGENGEKDNDKEEDAIPCNIRVEGFISEVGDLVLDFDEGDDLSSDDGHGGEEDSNGEGHEGNDYPDDSGDSSVEGRWRPGGGWR